jgi:transposase
MANHITMGEREAIIKLYEQGWHKRRIARELGLDRKTVRKHIREWVDLSCQGRIQEGKSPIMLAGDGPPKWPISPAGKIGGAGRPSRCEPYHTIIAAGVEEGLSGQRIFQDLRTGHGFTAAYDSVKRYLRRHFPDAAKRVWRMECLPGEEAQVDFGTGAPLVDEHGRRQRTYIFRIVLSYSRKAYSEAVLHQNTETFIRCLENAFRHFGGVPQSIVLDNLRAAVQNADWYDPD